MSSTTFITFLSLVNPPMSLQNNLVMTLMSLALKPAFFKSPRNALIHWVTRLQDDPGSP